MWSLCMRFAVRVDSTDIWLVNKSIKHYEQTVSHNELHVKKKKHLLKHFAKIKTIKPTNFDEVSACRT